MFELGAHDARPFAVIEHVEGVPLPRILEVIAEGAPPLPLALAASIVTRLAEIADHVVDLCPMATENVVVSHDGVPRIVPLVGVWTNPPGGVCSPLSDRP